MSHQWSMQTKMAGGTCSQLHICGHAASPSNPAARHGLGTCSAGACLESTPSPPVELRSASVELSFAPACSQQVVMLC